MYSKSRAKIKIGLKKNLKYKKKILVKGGKNELISLNFSVKS